VLTLKDIANLYKSAPLVLQAGSEADSERLQLV
jgi:hypothetical protein